MWVAMHGTQPYERFSLLQPAIIAWFILELCYNNLIYSVLYLCDAVLLVNLRACVYTCSWYTVIAFLITDKTIVQLYGCSKNLQYTHAINVSCVHMCLCNVRM